MCFITIQYKIYNHTNLIQKNIYPNFVSKKYIYAQNMILKNEIILLNSKLQRFKFLELENTELRSLLKYRNKINISMLIGNTIPSFADTITKKISINRGKNNGVYIGQTVIDAHGILGQVINLEPNMCQVMLITHQKSAVPVIIVRNGFHAIVHGTGTNKLKMVNITETTDVKLGDNLVTSGLDHIFPIGYQVGIITDIKKIKNDKFLMITVTPSAHLESDLYVLLFRHEMNFDKFEHYDSYKK